MKPISTVVAKQSIVTQTADQHVVVATTNECVVARVSKCIDADIAVIAEEVVSGQTCKFNFVYIKRVELLIENLSASIQADNERTLIQNHICSVAVGAAFDRD